MSAYPARLKTSRRLLRLFPWISGLVLVAGIVAFLIVFYGNTAKKEDLNPSPGFKPTVVKPVLKSVPVPKESRVVAGRFILTAVQRKHLAQAVEDLRDERHVRAGEDRDPDRIGVLLDRGLDDLLGCLVQPGVDHLHAGVAERPRDHLRATVVSVEADLGDHDPGLTRHQKTGVSRHTPHTSRSASHISPIVT